MLKTAKPQWLLALLTFVAPIADTVTRLADPVGDGAARASVSGDTVFRHYL